MYQHLEGLVAAPFTAVNPDLSANTNVIAKYASSLKNAGVNGVFINGSTGEGLSLTASSRKAAAEAWADACDDDFRLIVHLGDVCIEDCIDLAKHAEKIKAHAIGMFAPCYFKPANLDALIDYCAKVAAAAPATPFYYYHIPSMTGANFLMGEFLRKAPKIIPNLVGVKYTHHDIMDFMDCCRLDGGKYDILYGRDETFLAGLASGAKGAIGSTYNYMPKLYLQMMDAFKAGKLEEAQRLQAISIESVKVLVSLGNPMGTGKAIMKLCGLDMGIPLPPNAELSAEQYKKIKADLKAINFFDYSIG